MGGTLELGVAARREVPMADPTSVSGDAATAGPREIASLSPMIRMALRVRQEAELYGSGGLVSVFTNGPQGKDSSARPSNIAFGGRRIWEFGGERYGSADAGVEFAIPTGYARNDDESDAYQYALASRGGLGPWEWMPRTLSFVIPAGVSAQVSRRVVLDSEVAIAGMFPSIGDIDNPTVAAQISSGVRVVLPWLALGVRSSGVYNGRHPHDKTQVAIAPTLDTSLCRRGTRRVSGTMARGSTRCPLFLSAKMQINLDAPYGRANDDDAMGIWGLQFGLGWAVY